jgi:HD-GYP domain-containing protein (c-di-GMP phosphodiesterase class II)
MAKETKIAAEVTDFLADTIWPEAWPERDTRGRGGDAGALPLSSVQLTLIGALVDSASRQDATYAGPQVANYGVRLGLAVGLDHSDLQLLYLGGLLHDVGKLMVNRRLMSKPAPLSASERQRIRLHPTFGYDLCTTLRLPKPIGLVARHHHERWDGEGYPERLAGAEISLPSRIISIADSYEAMTNKRPYRDALSLERATDQLKSGAGRQWDPDLTRTFLDLIEQGQMH